MKLKHYFVLTVTIILMICDTSVLSSYEKSIGISEPGKAAEVVLEAVTKGELAYRLSEPNELIKILGEPSNHEIEPNGDSEKMEIHYPSVQAVFLRIGHQQNVPFVLYYLVVNGTTVDIGQYRPVTLRTIDDLRKIDMFWGLCGMSLTNLDLTLQAERLELLPFDTRTIWPDSNMLPDGFNPQRFIEEGKNPGLGIRKLHEKGINGDGIGIAIMDQPLLKNHEDYANRIVLYKPIDVEGVDVQMHGSPVCSIAVGKSCGVAPKASLYYYALPFWKWRTNEPYVKCLEDIIEYNKTLTDTPKIRVVSISLGAFSQRPNFDKWQQAVNKAEQNGILVVTCDPTFIKLATLRRKINADPDKSTSYERARYSHPGAEVGVVTGNRTIASHQGKNVYKFERQGGMSWAVPYMAGLAALAFQISPDIEPNEIVELWKLTASYNENCPVINPGSFIRCVKNPKLAQIYRQKKDKSKPTTKILKLNPTGKWESVDFVDAVDDFNPNRKCWQGDLFLKSITFRKDGSTDSFVKWRKNQIIHQNGKTKAEYFIKKIDDEIYMFFPWLSGDVTVRGIKPKYYVLKKMD